MNDWQTNLTFLTIAVVVVLPNGIFAAAGFAPVKVRGSQLDKLVKHRRPFAKIARWLGDRTLPNSALEANIVSA